MYGRLFWSSCSLVPTCISAPIAVAAPTYFYSHPAVCICSPQSVLTDLSQWVRVAGYTYVWAGFLNGPASPIAMLFLMLAFLPQLHPGVHMHGYPKSSVGA